MKILCAWGHIDTVTRTVVGPEGQGDLRELEARLLERLCGSANAIVSRDSLLTEVFGYAPGAQTRTLDTTVRRLRSTLTKVGADPTSIQTVYGEGYRWVQAEPEPAPVRSTLVGRVQERAAVTALLETHALVSLLGLGGMGKTSLAKDVLLAHPHGVFVDLAAAKDTAGVCEAVADGASWHLESDPVREIEQLLGTPHIPLWVFDNAEQVVEPLRTLLAGWLQAVPTARILVTSRRHLGIAGEQTYSLGPLSANDAAELFRQRAAVVAPSCELEADALSALMGDLEHHPLSIELAASRMRIMNLGDLRNRLSQRLNLLARGPSAEPRHQSIRAMVSTSLDLLDEEERSALMQASVLPNGFGLNRFVGVVEVGEAWPEDILQSLVEHHLIHAEPDAQGSTRFRLHAVVHALVREGADAALLSKARSRVIESLALECKAQELAWWPRSNASLLHELRAALQYPEVASNPEAEDVLITGLCQAWRNETRNPAQLGALLPSPPRLDSPRQAVVHAFVTRMADAERALPLAEAAVEVTRNSPAALQYDALFQRARCYSSTRQYDKARQDAQALVRLAPETPRERFTALCDQAIILNFTRDLLQVRDVLAKAEPLEAEAALVDRIWFRAVAVESIAELGDLREARRHAEAGYQLTKALGSPHQRDRAALDLGYVLALDGDLNGACQAMRDILDGIHPTHAWARVRAWSNLIIFECHAGRWDRVRDAMRAARRLIQTIPSSLVSVLEDALQFGCQVMGDLEEARQWSGRHPSSHQPENQVNIEPFLYAQGGNLDEAISLQRRNIEAYTLPHTDPVFLILQSVLGELLLYAGKTEEAKHVLDTVMQNIGTVKRRLPVIRAAHAVANGHPPNSGGDVPLHDSRVRCWTAFHLHQRGETVPDDLVSPVIEAIHRGSLPPTCELAWRLSMAGVDPFLSDSPPSRV